MRLLVGHEWSALVEVEIEDMVDVGDHHDLVLHVVLVECGTIPPHHRRRRFLLLVKLPAVELLLQLIFVDAVLYLFFHESGRGIDLGFHGCIAAAYTAFVFLGGGGDRGFPFHLLVLLHFLLILKFI